MLLLIAKVSAAGECFIECFIEKWLILRRHSLGSTGKCVSIVSMKFWNKEENRAGAMGAANGQK
jgi:hypothetical protein